MRRIIAVLFLALILIPAVSAVNSTSAHSSQTIAGFIQHEDVSSATFEFTPVKIGNSSILSKNSSYTYKDENNHTQHYKGLNLDIADTNNANQYLITPSATHELGLLIGTFNVETTNNNYTLLIYHSLLTSGSNSVDYEIGVSYSISGDNRVTSYCLANDSATPLVDLAQLVQNHKMISINLNSINRVVLINNGGVYFRLAQQVTQEGQYSSTITFYLGAQ